MVDLSYLKSHMYDVIGAIHNVHAELGAGLNEYCYQEGLKIELTEQNIPFEKEVSFHPTYHGKNMEAEFRIDFLCKGNIIVECKAVNELLGIHRAQLFNYMRLLKFPCGVLVNFFHEYDIIERYCFDADNNQIMGVDGRIFRLF